jgi:hypothetical protein
MYNTLYSDAITPQRPQEQPARPTRKNLSLNVKKPHVQTGGGHIASGARSAPFAGGPIGD